jgi:hypothetical protein
MSEQEREVVDAVLYAMQCGCFHPVPYPTRKRGHYRTSDLVKWGAMRHLHDTVAKLPQSLPRGGSE